MRRRPVLTLILLSSLTFFLGLGRQAITDMDEAYYAEASREMVEGGDWLEPHFNYEHRWEKPVLYYWLTAATYELTGPTEAAARVWSALSGIGLVLLTFAIAVDGDGDRRAAWIAGAITATCFGCFAEARLALPDLPLTFCITLAIWMSLRQQWVLAGIAAGLGVLTKGPIALVIPAVVILPVWWRERHSLRIRWGGVALGALLCVLVAAPWYVAMTLVHGRAYLESFFLGDNVQRFTTRRFEGQTTHGWWFYGPILLGGFLPWTGYGLAFLIARLARRDRAPRWQFTGDEWRLLLWGVMPLLFYSLSLGKQPRYILPVLPPLAILLARSFSRRLASVDRRQPALAAATLLTAALFALGGVLLLRARPLFINSWAIVTSLGISAMFGWAAALGVVAVRRQWQRLPVMVAIAGTTLLLTLQFGALAGARPEPVERIARMVRAYRVDNEPVGEKEVFVRNMVFYTGFKQVKDIDDSSAVNFLRSPNRVFLILRERDAKILRTQNVVARELGRVDYIDTGNIKLRTLLWPDPPHDIETVLLVTNQ